MSWLGARVWSGCANGQWFRPVVVKIPHFPNSGECAHILLGPSPRVLCMARMSWRCSSHVPLWHHGRESRVAFSGLVTMSPCLLLRKMGLVGPKHQAPIL